MSSLVVAKEVIEILEKMGFWDRVFSYFDKDGDADVLIAGSSGSGKTSVALRMSGANPHVNVEDRSPDREVFKGKLKGTPISLVTVPGQLEGVYRTNRRAAIRELAASKNLGVINCVSFGLNEIPLTNTAEIFTLNNLPSSGFLKDQRAKEAELTSEWSEMVTGLGGAAKWVITLINKADLWYGTKFQKEVESYYHSDAYISSLGAGANLPHAVLNFASNPQPFYDRMPMSGFYSETKRTIDYNRLVAQVLFYASGSQPKATE